MEINEFKLWLQDQGYSDLTIKKYLSPNSSTGRNKYREFKGQQNIIDLISQFKTHLETHNTPRSTINNYINDLNQYVNWLSQNSN